MKKWPIVAEPDVQPRDRISIDLDQNENPLGPPAEAVRLMRRHAAELNEYPDGLYQQATVAAAAFYGVQPEQVLITEGVDEAIDLALLHTGAGTCFVPGYWPYWERAAALSVPMSQLHLGEEWQPGDSVDQIQGTMFVTQPNNPTGNLISNSWIDRAIERSELLFLDESYLEFSTEPSRIGSVRDARSLCVFRTFSKTLGLAGLRIGVLLADQRLIAKLAARHRVHETLALYGVIGSLKDSARVRKTVDYVVASRPSYVALLQRYRNLFVDVRDTHCNFVLARCAPPWTDKTMADALDEAGIRVRRCYIMGLPGWIRVSIGPRGALARLEEALSIVDGCSGRVVR